jgi:hypothetical protein
MIAFHEQGCTVILENIFGSQALCTLAFYNNHRYVPRYAVDKPRILFRSCTTNTLKCSMIFMRMLHGNPFLGCSLLAWKLDAFAHILTMTCAWWEQFLFSRPIIYGLACTCLVTHNSIVSTTCYISYWVVDFNKLSLFWCIWQSNTGPSHFQKAENRSFTRVWDNGPTKNFLM